MPLLDITNPKIINFLLENYEKETKIRMRWLGLHKERIQECASFKREVKGYTRAYIDEAAMISGMVATRRDHIVAKRHRKKVLGHEKIESSVTFEIEGTREPIRPMMPIKQEMRNLLLESKNDFLKERNKVAPEEKYYSIQSTNWKYGWKLNDTELKIRGPLYGKISHLQHELQSRVGPQPDPIHCEFANADYTLC